MYEERAARNDRQSDRDRVDEFVELAATDGDVVAGADNLHDLERRTRECGYVGERQPLQVVRQIRGIGLG